MPALTKTNRAVPVVNLFSVSIVNRNSHRNFPSLAKGERTPEKPYAINGCCKHRRMDLLVLSEGPCSSRGCEGTGLRRQEVEMRCAASEKQWYAICVRTGFERV